MKVQRICLICNNIFYTQQCWINKDPRGGKYCSKRCRIESSKGKIPWNKGIKMWDTIPHPMKGRQFDEVAKNNMANARLGKHYSPTTEFQKGHGLGIPHSEEIKIRQSESLRGRIPWNKGVPAVSGENSCLWKGGEKVSRARTDNKRRQRGFVLLTERNSYTEPVVYHHIHPDLPYVVPCPMRIHKMFYGKTHFQNVNAMLGFKFESGFE